METSARNTGGQSSVQRKHRLRGKAVDEVVRLLNTKTGPIFDKYLVKVFESQGFSFDPAVENRSVYEPEKLFEALEKYDRKKYSYDRNVMKHAKAITLSQFGGHGNMLPLGLSKSLASVVKLDKSSGLPEFTTKLLAFDKDLALAREVLSEGKPFKPCIAYHRIQFGEKGPKTRLVWGYPMSATLVEARFAKPLIDHFLKVKSPMAFGLRKFELSAVTQRLRNCGLTYCLDYSKFDSSISAEFIAFAFSVLKTHFVMSEEEELAWNRVVSYFIHTTILMPDGFVYQKHGGVPSGSYFTQLVDSIVNFLAVQYMAIKLCGSGIPQDWLFVLGDDSIFTIPKFHSLAHVSACFKDLGLTVNEEKSVVAYGSDEVHFLGHYWPNGVASRPEEDLIKRLVTSEKPSKLPLPLQRGQKLLAFVGDCKEGAALVHSVKQLQRIRRLEFHEELHIATSMKGMASKDAMGHARALQAMGMEIPTFKNYLTLGLWLS